MKMLMITRCFTGLIDSISNQKWHPNGIPAIYKLIETLSDRNIPTDVLLLCKRKRESPEVHSNSSFKLDGLNIQFYVVPFKENFLINSTKVNNFINNVYQLFYCLKMNKKNKYSLVYSDRANVVFAAFFSFVMHKKVVLRLHGVYPEQKALIKPFRRLKSPITYLSYLANFSYIFCTQDGSGGEYFLSNLRRKNVPYEILLNGVDRSDGGKSECEDLRKKYVFKENNPVLLFVGKMEEHKGCKQFVESLIQLNRINQDFYAVLLGEGPLLEPLRKDIASKSLEDRIKIIGAVRHDLVSRYYQLADIYVSLNTLGNLSNTVLEAINAGKCLVILCKSMEDHIDMSTDMIIPNDCAVRVDRNNVVESLTHSLDGLLNDYSRISSMSANVAVLSSKILKRWDERMKYEVDILVGLMKGAVR